MLAIDSPDFVRQVQKEYLAQSLRVDGDGTYPKKVAIGTAKAPNGKRIVNGLLILPTQLFKHLT